MEITITIKLDDCDLNNGDNKSTETVISREPSIYARIFDDSYGKPLECINNPTYELLYLKSVEHYANERLKTDKYLYLNDVYRMLGIPTTWEGNCVGWVLDNPHGDGRVDFGIYEKWNLEFVNGCKKPPLLDFNVDGDIREKVLEIKWGA